MVKTKETLFNKKREYEWLVISQSYLECALMNARILSEKLREVAITIDSPLDFCLKKICGDAYSLNGEYLIFPIIFNLKHGIEIYLKAIAGIQNNKFAKNHNLVDLFQKIKTKDEEIKKIIYKYSFGHLLLPNNKKLDKENTFERYPQGSPYDQLEIFPIIDKYTKNTIKQPYMKSYEDYNKWMQQNNAEVTSIVTQGKIIELINDIEHTFEIIRSISISTLQSKK